MYLTLVLGPMFAGKTSFLINKYKESSEKILVVKFSNDNRYSDIEIVSHNGLKIPAISVNDLNDLSNVENYDVILIDEGQFYPNLNNWIRNLNFNGKIYISALNGDFKREPFGDIPSLISFANDIIFLKGKCYHCPRQSCYSKKIVSNQSQVDVGGIDKYVPVCEECYQ